MPLRRPFAALSTLGLAAHNAFETRAGVGLVFEPELGRLRVHPKTRVCGWRAPDQAGQGRREAE